jgi:hypothetical protein
MGPPGGHQRPPVREGNKARNDEVARDLILTMSLKRIALEMISSACRPEPGVLPSAHAEVDTVRFLSEHVSAALSLGEVSVETGPVLEAQLRLLVRHGAIPPRFYVGVEAAEEAVGEDASMCVAKDANFVAD